MNEQSEGFVYLIQNFPKISASKMGEGIFIGAQIKQTFFFTYTPRILIVLEFLSTKCCTIELS